MFGVPVISWVHHHSGTLEWLVDEPGNHASISVRRDEKDVKDMRGNDIAAAAVLRLVEA